MGSRKLIIYYNVEFILIYNWLKLVSKFFMTTWKLFLYRVTKERFYCIIIMGSVVGKGCLKCVGRK